MYNTTMFLAASFTSKLTEWTNAIKSTFESLGTFGSVLLVIIILWLGKFVVKAVGKLVEKALNKTSLDDKLAAKLGHNANVTTGVVGFVKAVLFLFVLIFALDAADLDKVSGPLNNIFQQILEFIPKLLLAGVMGYIVVMIAGVVKRLLTDVLNTAKVDERLGAVAGATPITTALASSAYAFFLLLFTPAVLDVLGIEAVSQPISDIVEQITTKIPLVFLAGILIFVGCFIGNIAKQLVSNSLQATNVNSFPEKLGLAVPTSGARSISSIAGTVVMITVIVTTLTSALELLSIPLLSEASRGLFTGYFNILLALLILVAGLIGARFAHDHLAPGNATLAKYVKYAISAVVIIVALNRTGIAPDLTGLPYKAAIYATAFAFGVGFAIAIGFGARGFVSRWFDKRG